MTTPTPPAKLPPKQPQPNVPPPPPPPSEAQALVPVLMVVIAAYLTASATNPGILTGSWEAVARSLKLETAVGGALDQLARRTMSRMRRWATGSNLVGEMSLWSDLWSNEGTEGKTDAEIEDMLRRKKVKPSLFSDLWSNEEPSVKRGKEAGIKGVVQMLRGVENHTVQVPGKLRVVPRGVVNEPLDRGDTGPHVTPNVPPPHPDGTGGPIPSPEPIQLPPALPDNAPPPTRLSPAHLYAVAMDLVDTVVNATTNEAGGLSGWDKTWVTEGDDRVRPSHQLLEGTTVPATDVFETDAGPIRFPHDPAAPYGETVNCRCSLIFEKAVARGPDVGARRRGQPVPAPGAMAAAADGVDGVDRDRAGGGVATRRARGRVPARGAPDGRTQSGVRDDEMTR